MNNEKIIVKMIFGSHLYGTSTETSDMDYKGIFCPTKEQVYLGKIPKSYNNARKKEEGEKNTADDVDIEMYSLHYFLKLACEGQTVAMDMLHAPENMITEDSWIWDEIVKNREKFYTKNLKAFVGYARRQAAKYSIRGSRLNAAKKVVNILSEYSPDLKLKEIWVILPVGEHCYKIENNKQGIQQYQVCGKIIQETASIGYAIDILQKFYENYGKRAKMAAENKGVDHKAVSHALRAAFQVKQLLTENTITFPLKEADYLREVKEGKLHYMNEVAPKLESLMEEVEELSEKSSLPEKVNRKFWDKFIMNVLEKEFS